MGDGVFGAFVVQDPENDPYYADGQPRQSSSTRVGSRPF